MRPEPPVGRRFAPALLVAAALALGTLALYAPVRTYDFINIDDDIVVYENERVLGGLTPGNARWALTATEAHNWMPLSWWSHMLAVSLFGSRPGPHHVVNAALHALNAALLFLLLRSLTGSLAAAAAAAALFAVHPLRVESVAWVSERKDVLSAALWLVTTLAYVRWCRRPTGRGYAAVAALLALGLMAKPMLVTLPLTLLLLDAWPLGRAGGPRALPWSRLVLEKAPLLALSLVVGAATFAAQRAGSAVISLEAEPLLRRLGTAAWGCAWYLAKLVWPSDLAILRLLPSGGRPPAQVAVAAAALVLASAVALAMARRRPYLAAGWAWYLVTLAPVSGLIQVGPQATADRYTYIPQIGIAIALAWLAAGLVRHRRPAAAAAALLALALGAGLAVATRAQLRHWRDTESLLSRAIAVEPGNYLAHHNLGVHFAYRQRWREAVDQYRLALASRPGFGLSRYNLGVALEYLGRPEEAVGEFEIATLTLEDPVQAEAARRRLDALLLRLGWIVPGASGP